MAQLLIQLARKEEEEHNPEKRQADGLAAMLNPELVKHVGDRLRKLRPTKKEALFNSIRAMFQFQGGISDSDRERIVSKLQKGGYFSIAGNGRVEYPKG